MGIKSFKLIKKFSNLWYRPPSYSNLTQGFPMTLRVLIVLIIILLAGASVALWLGANAGPPQQAMEIAVPPEKLGM
jgi:hypothetical protein